MDQKKSLDKDNENNEDWLQLTLTMWERQVHWYGCNALSIRLVNHVASIPICPWYHLIVSFLVVSFLFVSISIWS